MILLQRLSPLLVLTFAADFGCHSLHHAVAAANHVAAWRPDTNANTANYTTHRLIMAPAMLHGTVAGFRCHAGCNMNAASVFGRLPGPNEQKSANGLCVYVTR